MSWQTLRLTESILLLSIFRDLHILGMHIFVLWTVETQSTLAKNKNYDYLVFYISSGFSPSNSIDFIFLASDFLNIMNSYSTLSFVFMMLCNWTEPLVPSLLMALLKGIYPSSGSFLTVLLVTSTFLLSTQMCGFPWGCFGYSLLPWNACVFSAYACSSGSVFPDVSLSLLFFPFYWVWYVLFWYFICSAFLSFWS